MSYVIEKAITSLLVIILSALPLLLLGVSASPEEEGSLSDHAPYVPTGPWDRDNWTRYRNLNDTYNEFGILVQKFPDILRMYNLSAMYPHSNSTPRLTVEGRTLWALKISDDPDTNDTSEPEVFYCSMTHAREWISNEVMMYYINYVLHNYLVNETVNRLVNNTQMWFIPMVNPDGFQESIDRDDFNNSYGRFGWRKNKNETNGSPGFQNQGSGIGDGVDPNRNFGYQWNGPGSSTDPNYLTYRGSAPFSEVETQMIRELALDRDFKVALSFHSYSGLVLYPWGHTTNPAPDKALLKTIAGEMSEHNGYQAIQGALLYPVNGEFTDWMYGQLGIPAFTIEINDRDARYIPELDKIAIDCKSNREAAFILPKIADDLYSIFGSGINGTALDPDGSPIPDALVNISGKGRELLVTADKQGSFNISLEPGSYYLFISAPGGYENSSITVVPIGTYLDMDYILTETIPPVVESVDILQSGISTDTLEWGSQAMIRVREKYNEADLTGRVDVSKVGSTTPDQSMDLAENGSFYEVIWNTSRLQPGERYGLEANLVDHLGNIDDNGSDPEGYDRTVDIVDTTPPFIYTVQLLGDRNEDGSFELGSTISVEVYVKGGAHDEPSLKGNMTCSGISSTLKWAPGTDLLWGVIDTERTGKGTFNMIIRVSDGFDNEIIERIDLTVKDTTPPEFSLTMIEDSVEPIPAGSLLHLMLQPLEPDENLSASIQLLTRVDGEPTILEEFHNLIRSSGGYKFEWNTSGMQTGTFYLEGRLRDGEGNMLSTGALPGWDLSVRIVDLTPPEIESVWIEGFRIPQGERLTMMGTFDVQVRSTQMEPGMGCFLEISRDGSPVLDPIELGSDGNRTFVTSLDLVYPGFYTYDLEFSLGDRWGNIDPDGYGPGPDLTINYTRGRIQENITGRVDDHSWSSFEQGFVITGERVIMETYLTNITSGDGIYLIYNGIRSDLAPLREVRDNLTYLRVSFPTDLITGEQRLWWRIDLYDLGVLESRTLKFNVIDGKRGPVEQISIINWSDIDRGHISLNMTWHVPALASELWFRIYYMDSSGSFSVNISFDPGTSSVSIDVERRNLTIEVVAVHYLFPDHASRNVTMHIMDQKISRLEFSPPGWKEEEVPDERRDEGTEILPFILAAVVLIFVLAIASMIISRSKKGRLPELEME